MKIAYVHIPKTGGGSIKHWWDHDVSDKHELITYAHLDLPGLLSETGQSIDISFTVVRNTWLKLISNYEFAKDKLRKKQLKRPDDQMIQQAAHHHGQGIIAFTAWMRSIEHPNVRCQRDFSRRVEHVIVDHDPQQWSRLCAVLGVSQGPQRTHRVQHYDPDQYLNSRFIDWVWQNFQTEIDHFGFKPPVAK